MPDILFCPFIRIFPIFVFDNNYRVLFIKNGKEMKTKLIYLFAVLCSAGAFTACSNNNGGDDPQPDVPILLKGENIYSGDKLALTYSDAVMPGKQIKFATTDGKTGTLTMSGTLDILSLLQSKSNNTASSMSIPGVIPGETTTIISNIELKQSGNKYTFAGKEEKENRSVEFTGEVDSTKLTLSVNVKMTIPQDLIGSWNLKIYDGQQSFPIYAAWTSGKNFNVGREITPQELVSTILNIPVVGEKNPYQLLNAVLEKVTFQTDGNIIASYSKGENINNPQWVDSPVNMAQYYVKDNTIYLLLNPTMILSAFGTKAETATPMDKVIANLIEIALPMLGTGFPLTYKMDGQNLTVYADTKLVMSLLNAVSPLLEDQEFIQGIIAKMPSNLQQMMQAVFAQLPEVLALTQQFEVGINLNKQ